MAMVQLYPEMFLRDGIDDVRILEDDSRYDDDDTSMMMTILILQCSDHPSHRKVWHSLALVVMASSRLRMSMTSLDTR